MPAIALAVPAPALAASVETYGGYVCGLAYGAGNVDYQVLTISLGISSSTEVIPQGTSFEWSITVSGYAGGAHSAPITNPPPNDRWGLVLTSNIGATSSTFTATVTVSAENVTTADLACSASLAWTGTSGQQIKPATTVEIATRTELADPEKGVVKSSYLNFKISKRGGKSVNDSDRRAHVYTDRGGIQDQYPEIQYTVFNGSKKTACGDNANDTSTVYPDKFCDYQVPSQSSQKFIAIPARA